MAVLVLAGLVLVLVPIGSAGAPSSLPSVGARFSPATTGGCNPSNPSPSALSIPTANPTTSVSAGGSLGVSYAVAILSPTTPGVAATVYVPSVTTTFPLQSSGSFSVFIGAHTLKVQGAGWSKASTVTQTKSASTSLAFSTAKTATLSTQKIALMANASYGQLTLEIRWHWSESTKAGSTPVNGSWTVPSANATSPALPSTFYPAPYVPILSTSPTTAPAGSNISVDLSGAVANTSFRVVVEYPNNGTEITSIWHASPANATTFNVTAPLSFASGTPLPAGKYLLHIHDSCEAILHSFGVTATKGSGSGGSGGGVAGGLGRSE